MWRTGDNAKTKVNYKRVGDPTRNRWRAVHAWLGPFERKTLSFPAFQRFRDASGGPRPEDVSNYDEVKERLQCKQFSWYIDRFDHVSWDVVEPELCAGSSAATLVCACCCVVSSSLFRSAFPSSALLDAGWAQSHASLCTRSSTNLGSWRRPCFS